MRSKKPALAFIFVTLVLDVLGFGLLIPVAPRLVESLLHGGAGGTEAEAAPIVAALQSTFYAMSFLFAPMLGVLSDRFGRRPIILISLFGSGIDYIAMALAPNIAILFITRVFNGLSGASFAAANAYVADVTPPEKRAAGYGMIGAAFGVGFVIGPIIGGSLGAIDIRYPFYVAGAISLINWLYGYFVLPESLAPENRALFSFKRANPVGAFASLTKYPLVMGMAVALFFLNMAQFALHATWALSFEFRFDWSPLNIGVSLALAGVGAAIVQGGMAKRLIPMLGEKNSVAFGIVMGILAYVGYGAATHSWMIFVIIAVASIGAIGQPAGQALISKEVLPNEQGTIQGAISSLVSLAGVIGPLIGGWMLSHFIHDPPPIPSMRVFMYGANFYASAILAIIGGIAAVWAVRHHIERRGPVVRDDTEGGAPVSVSKAPMRK